MGAHAEPAGTAGRANTYIAPTEVVPQAAVLLNI